MRAFRFATSAAPSGRALTLACRGARSTDEHDELCRLVRRVSLAAVREAARANKVEHLAGHGLEVARILPTTDDWSAELDLNERAKQRIVTEVSALGRELARRGFAHAVIESAGVALASALPLRALGSGDFDVLVPADAMPFAVEFLRGRGFETAQRADRVKTVRVEFERRHDDGRHAHIELSTEAFDRAWVPLPFTPRERDWLARTVSVPAFPDLHVLRWSDALAQVAVHTSLHSYVRSPGLRLHADVERLARSPDADWSAAVAECKRIGAQTRAWVSLCMARDVLGAPIGPAAIDALAPPHPRAILLTRLLDHAGVLVDGRPKLRRAEALLLDALVDERSAPSWLRSIVLPDTDWLSARFGRTGTESLTALHMRRIAASLGPWRPE